MISGQNRVLDELARVGWEVDSISGLRESGRRYISALPILSSRLDPSDRNLALQEELVRALSVPWAKTETSKLIRMFTEIPKGPTHDNLRWAIGNALNILWDDAYLPHYKTIVINKEYGRAREMVVAGFNKCNDPGVRRELLLTLSEDPEVAGHAIGALAKSVTVDDQADPRVRAAFDKASLDARTWVRKYANRGLQRLKELQGSAHRK